jgi:ribosomal protein RSM22 (predicted rRNA methylase)
MDLPADLRLALAAELASTRPKELAGRVGELSARYRDAELEHALPFVRSEQDATAYAAYRLPATFAAVHAALAALRAGAPDLRPASLLDVGAGPGTALWAAAQVWPELRRATLLERDAAMIALGQRLARQAASHLIREATWRRADVVGGEWGRETSDLVVAAYLLGELPPAERDAVVGHLWAQATGAVVVVEPGTPRGFDVVRRARALLIAGGATIAAPCPHDEACPMPEGDWCHFAQRLPRTPLHRGVKAGTLSFEDEKFSYVAATRGSVAGRAPRVLRHPQMRKGHVVFELCTPSGLQRRTVSRKDGPLYHQARDARWGSTLADPGDDEDRFTRG